MPRKEPRLSWSCRRMSSGSRGLSLPPSRSGFLQRAITLRSHAHPRVHPRMSGSGDHFRGGGGDGPNVVGSKPPTHILLVCRNYGEVIYGLMIPARYIGSRVYTADMMTHYSTLPTVFYFSEWAPLYISYSSLLFKPPCIPTYFSSFQIKLRTSPLLIPIISLRVLLHSNQLLTLINSSTIVFNTILKKYAKSQRCIILINSSSLRSDLSLTSMLTEKASLLLGMEQIIMYSSVLDIF